MIAHRSIFDGLLDKAPVPLGILDTLGPGERFHVDPHKPKFVRIRREFLDDLITHKYELNEANQIYLPRHKVWMGGVIGNCVRKKDGEILPWEWNANVVTDEGINDMLAVYLHDTSKHATWYMAIHTAGSPATGDTAANYDSNHTESTVYDEATRVEWESAAPSSKSITNSANKATFTMNDTVTITGGAILSVSTKQSASGVLFCVTNYASSRDLVDDDVLDNTYALSAADDGA